MRDLEKTSGGRNLEKRRPGNCVYEREKVEKVEKGGGGERERRGSHLILVQRFTTAERLQRARRR